MDFRRVNLFPCKFGLTLRFQTSQSNLCSSIRLANVHPKSRDLVSTGISTANWAISLIISRMPMLFTVCGTKSLSAIRQQTSADVGSSFGLILYQIMRKFKPIRYASAMLPADSSLVRCNIDLCGRSSFHIEHCASTSADLFRFVETQSLLNALTQTAKVSLHIEVLKSTNILSTQEGIFKSIGMCLSAALTPLTFQTSCPEEKFTIYN
ncbi:MAG: hypothetical protein ACTS4U_00085 [Candidatus Hodgkinia cicadicola]